MVMCTHSRYACGCLLFGLFSVLVMEKSRICSNCEYYVEGDYEADWCCLNGDIIEDRECACEEYMEKD